MLSPDGGIVKVALPESSRNRHRDNMNADLHDDIDSNLHQ